VCEPIWAHIYDRSVVHLSNSHTNCNIDEFTEPKIEPEIVIHFESTPPESGDPVEILECVDWIANGLEIVQSHFPGWKFKAADTIADSALHATLLVGEPQSVKKLGTDLLADLKNFSIDLLCDGTLQEQGKGTNVLGSPLMAIVHLISVLTNQPDAPALKAGELVTTGTLTPALPVSAGQTWTTNLGGIPLPNISVTFET
jgi:2-oxo-3-hexenedioate decarboxylase